MEILYYTLTAIALYFLADWLLDRLETAIGRRLKYRSLVFFAIILSLALFVSQIVIKFIGGGS